MARPKESEREDIRALVLAKAKKLFLEEGYSNITMRRIAKEIGYTPGTIYLYFKNKEDLLLEYIDGLEKSHLTPVGPWAPAPHS